MTSHFQLTKTRNSKLEKREVLHLLKKKKAILDQRRGTLTAIVSQNRATKLNGKFAERERAVDRVWVKEKKRVF